LTRQEVDQHSNVLGWTAAVSRFGSWKAALEAAGLTTVPHARRWSDEDYFANLLAVWTHHGRALRYAELNQPPSMITNGSYAKKFGSWGAAKTAFLERVNSDLADDQPERAKVPSGTPDTRPAKPAAADQRAIRLGLRYTVLRRDQFRCRNCGRSPAAHYGCVLHVDHIHPFSRGGKTVLENLRTLCEDCNLGKGSTVDLDAQDAQPPELSLLWSAGTAPADRLTSTDQGGVRRAGWLNRAPSGPPSTAHNSSHAVGRLALDPWKTAEWPAVDLELGYR